MLTKRFKDPVDIFDTRFSCHGIGIFGIHQYEIGLKILAVALIVFDRCRLKAVAGKDRSDIAGDLTADKGKITLIGIGTHTDIGRITEKSLYIFKTVFERCDCETHMIFPLFVCYVCFRYISIRLASLFCAGSFWLCRYRLPYR